MVKKPLGDGTHKKKGRVVVCGKLPTGTTWGRNMRQHPIISNVENLDFIGLIV